MKSSTTKGFMQMKNSTKKDKKNATLVDPKRRHKEQIHPPFITRSISYARGNS